MVKLVLCNRDIASKHSICRLWCTTGHPSSPTSTTSSATSAPHLTLPSPAPPLPRWKVDNDLRFTEPTFPQQLLIITVRVFQHACVSACVSAWVCPCKWHVGVGNTFNLHNLDLYYLECSSCGTCSAKLYSTSCLTTTWRGSL